jgi:hypothetical protein
MNDYNNIACFLRDRIYLIDITKRSDETVFIVEEHFENYEIGLNSTSLKCSCIGFQNKISVCNHIKFVLENINKTENKRSKTCDELGCFSKIFNIDIKKNLDPNKFKCDRNPRYKEYKILDESDYNGNCYICLEKLSKKIIRCKHCSKYYHENCIYGWLRYGPACTCPNCRGQWM